MTSAADHAPDGITLLEAIRTLEGAGYTGQLAACDGGVQCFSCRTVSRPGDVNVERICRTEGASDPADMVAVAAVRCPSCHTRGTLALKYGPGSAPEEGEILALLDDSGRRQAERSAHA
ncbi:MAG TPA: hypothetical protein VHM89_16215 [Acidimicrobiales bacterium]|nr:hypothetical protein [Acidimicrobiales bacterium]